MLKSSDVLKFSQATLSAVVDSLSKKRMFVADVPFSKMMCSTFPSTKPPTSALMVVFVPPFVGTVVRSVSLKNCGSASS